MVQELILTINPGSTSTKIALYQKETPIFVKVIKHSTEEINKYERITDQYEFRKSIILQELKKHGINANNLSCIVGRGGLVKPIPSGVYTIDSQMREDLKANLLGEHASNLGGLLAYDIANSLPDTKAFIADPVVVDELSDIARFSGHPAIEKQSIFHALNHKAIGRHYAEETGRRYEDLNLIIVHLGGGISVGAHKKGEVIDVNDGLNGEGPFSPERSGGLAALSVAKLCFSGQYTYNDIKKMIIGRGGLVAYLGINNVKEVEERIEAGDKRAKMVLNAMSYQICKEIGAKAVVLKGDIDAILLTGGIAHSRRVTNYIKEQVGFLAVIKVYPGEDEMKALALNGLRALRGEVKISSYRDITSD